MQRYLTWRRRNLAKTAGRFAAHPWGYSIRWTLGLVVAIVLAGLIDGTGAFGLVVAGCVAGLLGLFLMRLVLGPHWVRKAGT